MESGRNYWNVLMRPMFFWGHYFITIKWDWGKFLPGMGRWLTNTIKGKQVIHSSTLLKLWIERKYAIDSIPVKSYKKCFVVLVEWTLTKRHQKSFPKAWKGFFTIVYPE